MGESAKQAISFELSDEHRKAIDTIAAGRQVRLSGKLVGKRMVVDFLACNAPFMACNAPFSAEMSSEK